MQYLLNLYAVDANLKLTVKRMLKTSTDAQLKDSYLNLQYRIAAKLAEKAKCGTAVLIFVAGMKDILELAEEFSKSPHYRVIVIHSDVPYEEQEEAFAKTRTDEVKIILATNAAESSVTLPDVDTVICLGTQKMIQYDAQRHQEMLCLSQISKASATQRAGRTGRVRPGTVYRLYSEETMQSFCDHDVPEVLRVPLQETILNLRVMLETSENFDGVVPILESMLNPPEIQNINASFASLYENEIINQPNDAGVLTQQGRFVGDISGSIAQKRFIYYSVLVGLEKEGVIIAAAMSLPRTPFRIANSLIHQNPDVFNKLVQKTFLAAVEFDDGAYSEPTHAFGSFIRISQNCYSQSS